MIIIPKKMIFPINEVKIKVKKDFFKAFGSLVRGFLCGLEEGKGLTGSDDAQKRVSTA